MTAANEFGDCRISSINAGIFYASDARWKNFRKTLTWPQLDLMASLRDARVE